MHADRQIYRKGQALVSITATITLLLGAMGLVIDIGYGRYEQQKAQSAVEAAAQRVPSPVPWK